MLIITKPDSRNNYYILYWHLSVLTVIAYRNLVWLTKNMTNRALLPMKYIFLSDIGFKCNKSN